MFVTDGNRCYGEHLINKHFYEKELIKLKAHAHTSLIEVTELKTYLNYLTEKCESNIHDKVGDF